MTPSAVLVTDFDGTLTQHDFYQLALAELIPADSPNFWADYRSGKITHFEALQGYFSEIRVDEATVLEVVSRMQVDPQLSASLDRLSAHGWRVIVASAGCDWYIRRLLADVRDRLEIYANPGEFIPGQGLVMQLPVGSPFLSPTLGVDKAGIVRHALQTSDRVAFAGDGYPDFEAARQVPDDRRFARGDLAIALQEAGLAYRPFAVWSEVAAALTEDSAS
ncbi:HAD-IB family phosphatase [Tuwongella immobilis]|uniref:2,3-diketo-5-methylthio-1-phosphopentane phosphatase n=1 Tax=Tuwongella immobilis TaxID=692036 RepID=A0A6C2YHM4_9BACT|nr:HAD-IB family phosphatase [Tuwongella immobilis]VIP00864.1 -diketo-5-methylthio-1-phosphopentane phosphatase : 2,3-diketo-5-methylthio-1-phosphopentane phosphatase OS=Desulfovibrio fructosivorans JJ GN=DesfrDRAFT_3093 PE=4 SV=1: HAD [Tuwongella immobilis]VTR97146.1 -diketo-5-methylthio-1-phosphopentane phosphatase : 2,3-diketo-5-methylthio-1-phosphopentane phosphatase OS=Desulfovibrio fructosivorans JJ GN=DesfrDRAFT_3093 PE=4 SV=1: HAD [Tuwongella immobilis]